MMETSSSTHILTGEPTDKFKFVYVVFYYIGLAIIFPYNMLITVNDFWMFKFRNVSEPFNCSSDHLTSLQKSFPGYFALSSNVPLTVFALVSLFISHLVSLKVRVLVSNVIMFLSLGLLVVVLADQDSDSWQLSLFNLVLVLNTIFCSVTGIYQAGILGNSGRFPPRYIGCWNDGMGLGGVLPAIINIAVLGLNPPPVTTGLVCLSTALLVVVFALPLYYFASKTDFYVHHSGIQLLTQRITIIDYFQVVKKSWIHIFSVFLCYTVTLAVYPGVTALVRPASHTPSTWNDKFFVPVCCFLVVSLGDWMGRSVTTITQWPPPSFLADVGVLLGSMARVSFIPLIMFCNVAPLNRSTQVLFKSDIAYVIIMVFFGFSSGYLANVSLMLGPKQVGLELQEAAGLMLNIASVFGLGLGSLVAPSLVELL